MQSWTYVVVTLAGLAAGCINTVAGSGTLITFPVLLAAGLPPVVANVTNTVGLAPGSISGALGMRVELTGQRPRLVRLGLCSTLGGITGGLLLLRLPAAAFDTIVPILVVVAIVLVVAGPKIRAMVARPHEPPVHGGPITAALVFLTGMYGGYFGAAQGVLLIGILGIGLDEPLPRINAAKNILAGLVNGVAAVLFIIVADVEWRYALLIAAGSIVGGQIGARVGRRLPGAALRVVIVIAGVAALVKLLLF